MSRKEARPWSLGLRFYRMGFAMLALLAANADGAHAACVVWDMNGRWDFHQSKLVAVSVELKQTKFGEISGTAESAQYVSLSEWRSLDYGTVKGSVTSTSFLWIVKWNSGARGEYSGTIAADGRISPMDTRDLAHPGITDKVEINSQRAKAECMVASAPKPANPKYQEGTDMPGKDYHGFDTTKGGAAECSIACSKESKCQVWTWSKQINRCWLKDAVPDAVLDGCCISGLKSKIIIATGKVIKAIGPAKVDHDVEVYNSPVNPRRVVGTMLAGAKARAVEHHQDGWCRLENIDSSDPPTVKAGWVAEDHFTSGKCPVQ